MGRRTIRGSGQSELGVRAIRGSPSSARGSPSSAPSGPARPETPSCHPFRHSGRRFKQDCPERHQNEAAARPCQPFLCPRLRVSKSPPQSLHGFSSPRLVRSEGRPLAHWAPKIAGTAPLRCRSRGRVSQEPESWVAGHASRNPSNSQPGSSSTPAAASRPALRIRTRTGCWLSRNSSGM